MEPKVIAQKLSPKSPKFIKPMEVFMMRKKKKLDNNSPSRFKQFSPLKCINIISPEKIAIKSPLKRKTPTKKAESKENSQRSKMTRIKSPRKGRAPKRQLTFSTDRSVPIITIDEDANLEAPPMKCMRSSDGSSSSCQSFTKLPIDWSLKTKLCFISKKPFPFKGSFKASEEAQGTTAFVRCLYSPNKSPLKQNSFQNTLSIYDSNQLLDTSLAAKVRQHCFVWMHPYYSWLSMFPRKHNLKAQSKGPPDELVIEANFDDWSNSLRSLYQLTKVRQNAYFYVHSQSFTILFRSAGVGAVDEINVLMYPTTSGFRKSLTEEDIKFTMPFASETQSTDNDETTVTQNNDIADDEESTVFLESLGLSQQDFPSLKQKVKTNSDSSKRTSLISMRGPDALLFVTFLTTNRDHVISKTGPYAGIPPTLLAPVAFHLATLVPLKLKEKEIVHRDEKIYSLEINGPILPNTVNCLCELMRETQDGNFSASLSTHESTIPFATVNGSITGCHDNTFSLFATESLKDSGFGNTEFLRDICVQSQLSEKSISNIVLNDNIYSLK